MPKRKRPMKYSKKDLNFFKSLLLKNRIELLRGLNHLQNDTLKKSQREASGDLSGYAYHMADMASDVSERDLLLQLASGERDFLLRIDDALKRMEVGEYGVCPACNRKITKTRLKAIPHAINCRICQEKEEKRNKLK